MKLVKQKIDWTQLNDMLSFTNINDNKNRWIIE